MREEKTNWKKYIALVVRILLLLTAIFFGENPIFKKLQTGDSQISDDYVLAKANLPVLAKMPIEKDFTKGDGELDFEAYDKEYKKWSESQKQLQAQSDDYYKGFQQFLRVINPQLLKEATKENKVYSPLNIYLAMSMLAETTAGNSRQEILDFLKTDNIESVRNNSRDLWKESYQDDGRHTSILANSIWLRDGQKYKQETLDILAKEYYTSIFSGTMGDPKYNNQIQTWVNENTKGLLKDEAGQLKFDDETIMAIVSTIYYDGAWTNEFSQREDGVFHALDSDINTTFMKQKETGNLYWGDNFKAYRKALKEAGSMWVIVPDKNSNTTDVITNNQLYDMLDSTEYKNMKSMDVTLTMPKFDTTSDLNLIETMKTLGVKDVFDESSSDFSNLSDMEKLIVSEIKHTARVKVDEKGLEAAAFTSIITPTSAPPMELEEIELKADKPFIFVITNDEGRALFSGIINNPNK